MLRASIHQSYFVVAFSVGVIVGTIVGIVFHINYFSSAVWCAVVAVSLILVYLKPKLVFMVIALMAGMVVVFWRISGELVGEEYIRGFYDQTVVVRGVVDGDPEADEDVTKFKLSRLEFGENERHATAGSLYVSINMNEEISRGDLIELSGKMTNGFGTYAGYLHRPRIKKWVRPEPGDLVLRIRNWFSERIRRQLKGPEVKLGLSYLLGMRAGLSDELNEKLRAVGLIHIVVASGAHLSILVEFARKIFGRISRFAGAGIAILFVGVFMSMVGWTPSILRAGIMTMLGLLAWYVGRKFEPWRIILIVMAITLLINPMFIMNLGWLMSFASYGGIMILGPRLTKYYYGTRKPGFIGSTIMTTLCATVMTLPITLYYYGQLSLISVFANLLILPTLPFAMGLVFMTGLLAGIPGIEMVISFLATKILEFHVAVVEFFGGMKGFMVEIKPYQAWVFALYIVVLGFLGYGFWKKRVILRARRQARVRGEGAS